MSYQDLLSVMTGFLSGSFIATLVSVWWQSHAAKITSERRHLEDALQQVYGPVVRLLKDCQMLLRLSQNIQEAGRKVLSEPVHESAREERSQEIKATIESGNAYTRKVRENIDEVVNIASAGSHLIDLEDMEVFNDIHRQCVRMEIEFESSLAQQVPFEVKQELGAPSYFRAEWLAALEAKHQQMMARLARLAGLKKDKGKAWLC